MPLERRGQQLDARIGFTVIGEQVRLGERQIEFAFGMLRSVVIQQGQRLFAIVAASSRAAARRARLNRDRRVVKPAIAGDSPIGIALPGRDVGEVEKRASVV